MSRVTRAVVSTGLNGSVAIVDFCTSSAEFGASSFTFVNAARVLLTRAFSEFRSWPLTFVNDALTVVNGFAATDGDEKASCATQHCMQNPTASPGATRERERSSHKRSRIIHRTESWLWYIARMIE